MISTTLAVGLLALYWAALAIYRLYLSPLAKFPGPKLAALTSWYCAYHDIVRGGQYIWVIEDMHRKYGPIVRTRPDVLHVNDPAFVDKLYSQSPNMRRERAHTVLAFFVNHLSVMPTRDHDLHRQRRALLSKFFSQQNVRRLVPVINDTLADLLARFEGWAKTGQPIAIHAAYKAAAKDVIQSYALGEGRKYLHMEDCNAPFFEAMSPTRFTHLVGHIHCIGQLLVRLPPSVLVYLEPKVKALNEFVEDLGLQITKIRNAKERPESRTIFDEIIRGDVPELEKSTPRLVDEAMVLTIAGSDTTASTMLALTYHVLSDPAIFSQLRAELDSVMHSPDQAPDPVKIATLPFLNALIEEAVRLYPGVTYCQDRVAPDEDLIYQYADGRTMSIPAGTVVGMAAPILNRHTSLFHDADKFMPSRYLENPALLRRNLTFSKGGRQCLGISLAYQEMQMFTAGIFRKYSPFDSRLQHQNGPTLELYETTQDDVKIHSNYVTPGFRPGSKGVRVIVREN